MRIRTILSACGVAAALLVGTAGVAAAADGPTTVNGNGSTESFGNTATGGNLSPQIGLVQGSLNKPCVAVPVTANLGSLVGLVNVAVQDVHALDAPQNQQCAQNSSQIAGDGALSHILSGDSLLSAGR